MESIALPNLKTIKEDANVSVFEITPLYPGYGNTVANILRRVLLSSLEGTAVDSFMIEGIDHEFSSIDGVREDVIEIMLNLKSLKLKLLGEEDSANIILEKNQPGDIFASDFQPNSSVEILDPTIKIATLDKKINFNLVVNIKRGRGYQPVEEKTPQKEIGLVIVDSFFSPVEHVSFSVENTRVGQATNFDKITLTVKTDGSVTPRAAVEESGKILVNHFALISNINAAEVITQVKEEIERKIEEVKESEHRMTKTENLDLDLPPVESKTKIEDTDLSGRTKNALLAGGYKTLSGLGRLSEIKLAGIKGLGVKGLEEVQTLLKRVEQ